MIDKNHFNGHGTARKVWTRRLIQWGLIWAIWTFIGLVFTLQGYFTSYRSEKPIPFVDSLYLQMTWSYVWALATPLVLWVARKLPIDRGNWWRAVLLHAPICLLITIVATGIGHISVWLYWGWRMGRPFSFERMGRFIVANFTEGIGIYLLIALAYYAFTYYRRYQEGRSRTLQLQAQLSQAELQALKMQLHPHFLFNTLHSISALMHTDIEAARRMITRLGDLLRLTLDNSGVQEITLQQEMEFLRSYLEIEQIRFQDRLQTHVDIPVEALDAKVPNLILQPIVENAIRHGIASTSMTGRVEIHAQPHNGKLRIQVRDNGPGMIGHRTSENPYPAGVGLANTEARLKRLYGAAYLFDLTNGPNGGLLVTLEIPFTADGAATRPTAAS